MLQSFVHLTDTHLGDGREHGWAVLDQSIAEIAAMQPQPDFLLVGGDIVDPASDRHACRRFREAIGMLPIPAFSVVGNHDLEGCRHPNDDPLLGKQVFIDVLGPRYQAFDWGGTLVVTLDTYMAREIEGLKRGYERDMDAEQLSWFHDQLLKCNPGDTVVVGTHASLLDHDHEIEPGKLWRRISSVLREDLDYLELCGHSHLNAEVRRGNWRSVATAALCGTWWSKPVCIDASNRGYAIIRREAGGFRRYYREVGQPLALAAPERHAVHADSIRLTAIDPRTGSRLDHEIPIQGHRGGWIRVPVELAGHCQEVTTFVRPHLPDAESRHVPGHLAFTFFQKPASTVEILCNGVSVAAFDERVFSAPPRDNHFNYPIEQLPTVIEIPTGLLRKTWNCVEFKGDALVTNPVLRVDERDILDARVEALIHVRRQTCMQGCTPVWDTGMNACPTMGLGHMREFFFEGP